MAKLSVELERYFFEEERGEDVKLEDILVLAGERIFGFLLVMLSLPSALPLPAPGYSIPFGIVIFLLAIQMIAGAKTPWLPEKVRRGSMKLSMVQKFVRNGLPWLRRIEALTRPRLTPVCTSLTGRVILGIAIALMGISMIIPIPGTNTLPAMGVFVTAFGLQEDDGFISLAGLALCLVAGTLSTSIIMATIWGGRVFWI
jgi:hypothetical protein